MSANGETPEQPSSLDRRTVIKGLAVGAAAAALPPMAWAAPTDASRIRQIIEQQHDANLKRIQTWIHQPSIAAENRGVNEGCELTMQMLREAGFDTAVKVPTDGQPGIFATLDAGAKTTIGLYFMYDVKQVDPAEWSSPPWDAALVDKPGLGKVIIGRGAVNQKGPEGTFLAALHAIRGAGMKMPVNLVLVAEGEEEIGSPHFHQIVHKPDVQAALAKCSGIFMPAAGQGLDGIVTLSLGAKGVIELELVSSGEKWGRGPTHDIHSSQKAHIDSPAWRLVQALNTLVTPNGQEPAIDGFFDKVRPTSAAEKAMIAEAARRLDEKLAMKSASVTRWMNDEAWVPSLERLETKPTVNIEGLVGGYTGVGGKTVLPHRAVAKLDLRLVPDMTAEGALENLKAHLAKRGFGDIEVNMSGGYNPTQTSQDAPLIQSMLKVYRKHGIDPVMWPRNAGSYPGYVFTDAPLNLAAGHYGLGHGSGAHAPDEYYVIESSNPKIEGLDGAVRSHVDFLFELAG